MKEIQISFNEEVYQRIEELATFLDIDEFKIANVSFIFGLYKYLLPYKERISTLSEQKLHKLTDDIIEFRNKLKNQVESDYTIIEDLTEIEKDFEDKFQAKLFTDSEQWRTQFFDYLGTPPKQELEQVEEITEKREPIISLLKRKLTREKPEKIKIKKERYEPPVKLLPKEKIGMYLFFASVLLLILFMFIWAFFPELQFLHGYSIITVSVLLSLIGLGLVIHYRQVTNWTYFIHRHGLFFIFAVLTPVIIFTPLRFSEVHIWVYNFTLAFFFLIVIPLIIMGFIAAFYYHYFPSLAEWKDKRNVKRMTYRFIAECPFGTFKDSYERAKAFAGFIQDQDKVGDLLE